MTQVETYECSEVAAEPPDISEEAAKMIRELKLTGQERMLKQAESGGVVTQHRMPYRRMREDERFVYETLCPTKTDVQTFAGEPMPLRVLQVLAHARELDAFETVRVWHQADSEIKDPVLVGERKERPEGSSFDRTILYILARWGEELDEWPALVKRALTTWKLKTLHELNSMIQKAEVAVSAIERDAYTLEGARMFNVPYVGRMDIS